MTDQVQKSNLVEVPGDQVVEHSVPQELKALVAVSQAIRIVGGMRKGLRQDRGEHFNFKQSKPGVRSICRARHNRSCAQTC